MKIKVCETIFKTMHEKINQKNLKITNKETGYSKKVSMKTTRLPNKLVETFFVDNDKDSVQIFAVTKNKEVLVVKQWRPNTEEEQCELPGGGLEKGEEPLKAAERELLEETGYKGDMMTLTSIYYSPFSTGMKHMFVAIDCEKVADLDLDPNEILEVHVVPMEKFMEYLENGKIRGIDTALLGLKKLTTATSYQ